MMTKIFTVISGPCPFGCGCDIDSSTCRRCEWFYRAGTATFFWCRHPVEQKPAEIEHKSPKIARSSKKIARKAPETEQPKRKRGRPAKKAENKPIKGRKNKK